MTINKKTLKNLDRETLRFSYMIIGGSILFYKWLPKACMKAYDDYKANKNGKENNECTEPKK